MPSPLNAPTASRPASARIQHVPRRPALIAHRGMPRRYRENTLPGFIAATAAGADGWELDVHATRDGVVVVHHDPVLPAAAGSLAGRAIADLDYGDLATVSLAGTDERIPTLDDVLGAAAPGITVYVEIKAVGIEEMTMECLRRHPGVETAIHCFDHRVARRVNLIDPTCPVGILSDSYLVDTAHAMGTAGARDYWPHRTMVDAALVTTVHGAGGRVIVWTVNDVDDARRLAALGVDALCSDVIDELRAALAY